MSSQNAEKRMIDLISSDGETFEVEEAVAVKSQTIKHIIEDDCFANGIPLPNVTSNILSMVIEYCKRHAADKASDDDLKKFDADFTKDLDRKTLFDLTLAANYLSIEDLLDLACQAIADTIKLMSVEQVREVFDIENDFTEEEEAEVRQENDWAFQD